MILQIADWTGHYENSRSREIENCTFVCVPNKQHGTGFTLIMAQPDGAMIYGIWHCILGSCSRQHSPRNGWITADGTQSGTPLDADDLAAKFHRPVKEVVRAIEFLTSKKVGWLLKHEIANGELMPEPPKLEPVKEPDKRFAKPTVEQVSGHFVSLGMAPGIANSEADRFCNYYESNGWRVGKNPMRSWPSAVANWKKNCDDRQGNGEYGKNKSPARKLTSEEEDDQALIDAQR